MHTLPDPLPMRCWHHYHRSRFLMAMIIEPLDHQRSHIPHDEMSSTAPPLFKRWLQSYGALGERFRPVNGADGGSEMSSTVSLLKCYNTTVGLCSGGGGGVSALDDEADRGTYLPNMHYRIPTSQRSFQCPNAAVQPTALADALFWPMLIYTLYSLSCYLLPLLLLLRWVELS
ncbi:hypothetical protein DFP73DRAFT_204033 [Morchella snyderi]|nr:hypothetical protein DFP73DRAFT_204033 [Morchella snyderi]